MLNFILSVVNAVQPFIGWVVTGMVFLILFLAARFGGSILVQMSVNQVKGAAGIGVSAFWGTEKGFVIGILNQQISFKIMQGEFLIVNRNNLVQPAPAPVAPVSPAPPQGQ